MEITITPSGKPKMEEEQESHSIDHDKSSYNFED